MADLLPLNPDELLSTTRAVRERLDLERPVPLEVVREALQLALQAPSGGNRQGWHWIVLTDEEPKKRIAELYARSHRAVYRAPDAPLDPARARILASSDYLRDLHTRNGFQAGTPRPRRCAARQPLVIRQPEEIKMGTFNPSMQKATLSDVDSDVHGLISKRTAELDGVAVTEVTFAPGARWSQDLKSYAGTELCELPHVAVVVDGRLAVQMADGSREEFAAGDVMLLPPGHDAWSVGDRACRFVEFSRGNDYYS